ncbi:uncharacterized protein LOC114722732 isoform X2 [Neltuma alba]|uniref:uncharacterized protein LOC114722732 isoform X2 n=1 Tax=Neltuma alba TaxID=207710 RepID=UPI0010A533EC|nr:uncharacterized protein LOC114722732 isoform X2 [Prosopis alba]
MFSTDFKAQHDHEFPQKSGNSAFQIKQDDQFFCRLLSKESSISHPSFRALAIPFEWESEPGTPKRPFSETTFPALTPPPCYYFKTTRDMTPSKTKVKKRSRFKLLKSLVNIIFCRYGRMEMHGNII